MPLRTLTIAICVFWSTFAQAQFATPDSQSFQRPVPARARSVIRGLVRPMHLPMDATYDQLTEKQRTFLRGYYVDMPASDDPPYPIDGLISIFGALVSAQAKLLVTGPLSLQATVDSNGIVQSVLAVGSPSEAMTKFATSLLLVTKFKPARCGGTACVMEFPVYVEFTTN